MEDQNNLTPEMIEDAVDSSAQHQEDVAPGEDDELFDTNTLGYKLRHCSEPVWLKVQIAGGVLVGLLAVLVMFVIPETETLGPMRWAIGLVIALVVPRLIENGLQREILKGKIALLVTFGLGLVAYSILGYLGYMA